MTLDGGSGPEGKAELELGSPTGPVELRIIDSDFRPVAEGTGTLTAHLAPGIYEVVAQAGPVTDRRLVRLTAGERRSILDLSVAFPSAAPVADTSTTHEYHQGFAYQATQLGEAPQLDYGGLVVVVRDVRGREGPPLTHDDLRSLSLLDSRLSPVGDFGADWQVNEHDASAAWGRHIPAGGYALRSTRGGSGDAASQIDQSLWIVAGWQTIVFLTRTADGETDSSLSLYTIPLTGAWQSFEPRIGTTYELAQWQLRSPQSELGRPDTDTVIRAVDDNIMLGVVLAHALLVQSQPDTALVGRLVATLERHVPDHPDVLALRLLADDARRTGYAGGIAAAEGFASGTAIPPVTWPPMLLASYLAVLRLDADAPGTIAPGSVAESAAEALVVGDIWTAWRPVRLAPGPVEVPDGPARTAGRHGPWSPPEVLARLDREPGLIRTVRPDTSAERRVGGYLAGVADLVDVDPEISVRQLKVGDVARATHLPYAVAERALIGIGLGLPEPPPTSGSSDAGPGLPPPRRPPFLPFLLAVVVLLAVVGGVFGPRIIEGLTGDRTSPEPTAGPIGTEAPVPTTAPTEAPSLNSPQVSSPPVPSIRVVRAIDFGSVEVPGSTTQNLSIANSGGLPIVVQAFQSSGNQPDEFALDPGTCLDGPIQPGDSCRAVVTFRPITAGPRDADVMVSTDQLEPTTVHLSGIGIETGEPRLDPPTMSFTALNAEPIQRTATIVATGPLTVVGLSIEGTYASEFADVAQDCVDVHLVAHQACHIVVQYTPPSGSWVGLPQDRDATLVITTASGKVWTITLLGQLTVIL